VPAVAQAGLKPTQVALGHFHPCVCRPSEDIEIDVAGVAETATLSAQVIDLQPLNGDVRRVRLQPRRRFEYRPGQYLRLHKDRVTARCYSLGSVPELEDYLELHVRKVPGGNVSTWVHDHLRVGDEVEISSATGESYYLPGEPQRGLCLVATSCGLAPLLGIARDALHRGHRGPIRLYHGAYDSTGFYCVDELRGLAAAHGNFTYQPCVSAATPGAGEAAGFVHEVALAQIKDLAGWKVHLCGHPGMVASGRQAAFLAGAAMRDIHADPFPAAA